MRMDRTNEAYLINDTHLLAIQGKPGDIEYHCFDMDSKNKIAEGHLAREALAAALAPSMKAAIRKAVLNEAGLSANRVAVVSPQMLEEMRGGRKLLSQMQKDDPALENARSIRFIDSSYHDRFKLPDGGVVEIQYPDRHLLVPCEYMDDYHLRFGFEVLHICQLAEMLERGGGTCRPESIMDSERAAWSLGSKGYLALQACEDGYDYTLFQTDFSEIDGGHIDDPELTMNEARDHLLTEHGFGGYTMREVDYDALIDKAACAGRDKRTSVLDKLADTLPKTETAARVLHRAKEAER